LVDHRDLLGGEPFDARRDQVDDAVDLRGRQRPSRRQLDHHRRRRAAVLGNEPRALGERQMHACRFDAAELADRPPELALERTLVVQALHEVGLTEALLVEDLEADAATLRQPAAGERQAQLVELLRRHEHGPAAVVELERHLLGAQRLDDRGRVLLRQVGEERPVERPLHPPGEGQHAGERAETDRRHHHAARRGLRHHEGAELRPELLDAFVHLVSRQTCIRMTSWYASTILLRTCIMSLKESSAFWMASMVSCRLASPPVASDWIDASASCWSEFTCLSESFRTSPNDWLLFSLPFAPGVSAGAIRGVLPMRVTSMIQPPPSRRSRAPLPTCAWSRSRPARSPRRRASPPSGRPFRRPD